jgi:hypothetical protein
MPRRIIQSSSAGITSPWLLITALAPANFSTTRLTEEDIKALVASLRDITATLTEADPADKAAAYAEMGITVTYQQDGRVLVESRPGVVNDGVGGATQTLSTRDPWEAWLIAA